MTGVCGARCTASPECINPAEGGAAGLRLPWTFVGGISDVPGRLPRAPLQLLVLLLGAADGSTSGQHLGLLQAGQDGARH